MVRQTATRQHEHGLIMETQDGPISRPGQREASDSCAHYASNLIGHHNAALHYMYLATLFMRLLAGTDVTARLCQ